MSWRPSTAVVVCMTLPVAPRWRRRQRQPLRSRLWSAAGASTACWEHHRGRPTTVTETTPSEVQTPSIGQALLRAAEGHARFALRSYLDEQDIIPLQAAVAGGAAVELLIKAVLFRAAPALVAMRGDVHSTLVFSGKPGVPGKGYLDCRTIGADDAKKALVAMRPSLNLISTDVDVALKRRNAAVHLAIVTKADLVIGIRAMCVTVAALLPELALAPKDFWGESLAAHAETLAGEEADQRRLLLEQLKTVAADRLARMRSVDPRVLELLAAERAASEGDVEDSGEEYSEAHQCPVCEYWGFLSGPVTRGDLRSVESEYYDGWEVERAWYPNRFACDVCGLVLDPQTLGVAGFPTSQDLDSDDATQDEVEDMILELQADYEYDRWRDEGR